MATFMSWTLADTQEPIMNKYSGAEVVAVKMLDNHGNEYIEMDYEGYGIFGGKDYYVLLAEMNGFGSDREKGLELGDPLFEDWDNYIYPKFVALECSLTFDELERMNMISVSDVNQGYFSDNF